jgi:hypothetical protein
MNFTILEKNEVFDKESAQAKDGNLGRRDLETEPSIQRKGTSFH